MPERNTGRQSQAGWKGGEGVADPVVRCSKSWLWERVLTIPRKVHCGPMPISDAVPALPQVSCDAAPCCETLDT
jgi:hypothetical protein